MALGFRPTLWPTLLTLPAVLLLVVLGNWQMDRLAWKQALIGEMQGNLALPLVPLPPGVQAPKDWEFRRVRVEGRFHHDREMLLNSRVHNGQLGVEVVTPLQRDDGSVVLVNRGWVPQAQQAAQSRPAGQIAGVVTIEGVLRRERPTGYFTPKNVPGDGLWFYVDLAAMARWAGADRAFPLLLEAGPSKIPGQYPGGKAPGMGFVNNHLDYALTWYALAVVLLIVYLLYHLRRRP